MSYPISAAIEISLDNSTWYKLTDHNREPIQANPELIESSSRMANGKMRKYVISKKMKFNIDWSYVPTKSELTVDGNKSSAWLDAFYDAYVGIPIYIKIISSGIDPLPSFGSVPLDSNFKTSLIGFQVYSVFITSYSSTIVHRTKTSDYSKINIEFTEI